MSNLPSVDAVADYFLLKIHVGNGDAITNLKMQKLCYYAQAWSLALRDSRPMFSEPIEAWALGPVCPSLYKRFKKYKWQAIDPTALKTRPLDVLSEEDRELLDGVWNKYGSLSATQLKVMTHAEEPWKKAYDEQVQRSHCNNEIDNKDMQEFYGQQQAR